MKIIDLKNSLPHLRGIKHSVENIRLGIIVFVRCDFSNEKIIFLFRNDSRARIASIQYQRNNLDHRDHLQGPSYVFFDGNGVCRHIRYEENSLLHRPCEFGPAYQRFDESGNVIEQSFYEHDRLVYENFSY